jgi:hypothetical protein
VGIGELTGLPSRFQVGDGWVSQVPVDPSGHCACSWTPVGLDRRCGTKSRLSNAAPAQHEDEGSRR